MSKSKSEPILGSHARKEHRDLGERLSCAASKAWFKLKISAAQIPEMINPGEIKLLNEDFELDREPRTAEEVAAKLQRFMLGMKGRFMQEDGKGVNYAALKESEVFADYRKMCGELQAVDLSALDPSQKIAFFLSKFLPNVRDMSVYGVLEEGYLSVACIGCKNYSNSVVNLCLHVVTVHIRGK